MSLTMVNGHLDILTLYMALHRTWRLQMDKMRKILVSQLFLVGLMYAAPLPLCKYIYWPSLLIFTVCRPTLALVVRLAYFANETPSLACKSSLQGTKSFHNETRMSSIYETLTTLKSTRSTLAPPGALSSSTLS